MKRTGILFLLALLMISCAGTENMRQGDQGEAAYKDLDYPELNDFQKPEVQTFTAPNGIKYFLIEDHELPLINVDVNVRTGGVLIPNKKAGLASITGTVIRSGGTDTYPADTLNTILENRAASIETGIGFSSGGASMNVLKEDFDTLLPIFVDVLSNPTFPDDKIQLAKKQTKSAISRRNDNNQQIGYREFDRLIYGKNSVYGRNTEYETIDNITRQDLINFHDNHFVASNLSVGVAGDFDAVAMKKKLQKAFSKMPKGDSTELEFPEIDYKYEPSINFINKSDVNQSFVLMGHIGGLRENPDYAEIQVMNQVLSAPFTGRLFQVVRTDMGLAYSVFGQYEMNSFYPGTFYTGVLTKSATTAQAIDAIKQQIVKLQNQPISQAELQATKDQILNSAVFQYDSYEQVLSQQMSYNYRGLPTDAFEKYIAEVKKTTVEDVQNMAQKYLHPDALQILVVGNEDEIGDQLQKYGDVNRIDISIPEPGGEQRIVEGDAARGKEILNKMADAVIDPDTELNTLTVAGNVVQGGRTLSTTMTIEYPDAIEQTIESPMGELKLSYKGGSGTLVASGQERPLPPQMAKSLKSTLNRSFISIALNLSNVDPQFMGTENMNGINYYKINTSVEGTNVVLLINPKTFYPDIVRYQQFNPQMGKQMTVENHYSDWEISGGVAYPHTQITLINGSKSAEANYDKHEVN